MDRTVAGIPRILCALRSFIHIILISWCRPQILNFATFSDMLLAVFIVSFCPSLSCQDVIMNYSLISERNSTLLS